MSPGGTCGDLLKSFSRTTRKSPATSGLRRLSSTAGHDAIDISRRELKHKSSGFGDTGSAH